MVVADRHGPRSYDIPNAKGSVVFLTLQRQQELAKHIIFVEESPWSQFSRKNIAYLYAIANGAHFIWDFDENNALMDSAMALSRYTESPTARLLVAETGKRGDCGVFNPYPYFKATVAGLWPRGLPRERATSPGCRLASRYYVHEVPSKHIGILQSIASNNPDVDHASRVMQPDPITFMGSFDDLAVVVPPGALSPMNSQASLFSRVAFWSIFLPTLVTETVSDTWRSYIAQALGKSCDMLVVFAGPLVTRDHSSRRTSSSDHMCAESKFQEKSERLVSYLIHEWRYDHAGPIITLEGALERLYADLYEIGVFELEDVRLVQLWISTLRSIGYKFPVFNSATSSKRLLKAEKKKWKWTGAPFDDVVLVGQFNYNTGFSNISQWIRRWREVFTRIDVRGPFDTATMDAFRDYGVNPFVTAGEWGGLYSPVKTMGESLRLYANDSSIRGVVVVHDDLLFNVSYLVEQGFPSDDSVMGNFLPESFAQPYLYVYGNNTFRLEGSQNQLPIAHYEQLLEDGYWYWWPMVIPRAATAVFNDTDREEYIEVDGGLPLYRRAQVDFVYVPTSIPAMSEQYAAYADFMFRNQIMLEVGTTSIIGRLKRRFNFTTVPLGLCTEWVKTNRKHLTTWVPSCLRNWTSNEYALYHPIKAGNLGLEKWNSAFDALVLGTAQIL